MPKIANYLGKTVFVSLPRLHEEGAPRPFTLVGVEDCGLWLESHEADGFARLNGGQPVMVPFGQIAYVGFGAPAVVPPPSATESAKTTKVEKPRQEARRRR